MTDSWIITNVKTQTAGGFGMQDLAVRNGCFTTSVSPDMRRFDADGLIAMPGIIDLHGDGFERHIAPRNGVEFDLETALLATDRELLANGITTAFLALTISWEPGPRSLQRARDTIAALVRLRPHLKTEIRLQIRWEIFALEAVPDIESWLDLDPSPTLAFNDHLTAICSGMKPHILAKNAARCGMSVEAYKADLDRLSARAKEVPLAVRHLADMAAAKGVICFAHDEQTPQERDKNRGIGITVCEFPITADTAKAAIANGEATVLGAPNVLRGKSHTGAVDATEAIHAGLCSVLASDYYYAAPLAAMARLGSSDPEQMAKFWPLISANAAAAVGLDDRGHIAPDYQADFLLYHMQDNHPQMVAVFRKGECIHLLEPWRV